VTGRVGKIRPGCGYVGVARAGDDEVEDLPFPARRGAFLAGREDLREASSLE
jgi:hypothetical protein